MKEKYVKPKSFQSPVVKYPIFPVGGPTPLFAPLSRLFGAIDVSENVVLRLFEEKEKNL